MTSSEKFYEKNTKENEGSDAQMMSGKTNKDTSEEMFKGKDRKRESLIHNRKERNV